MAIGMCVVLETEAICVSISNTQAAIAAVVFIFVFKERGVSGAVAGLWITGGVRHGGHPFSRVSSVRSIGRKPPLRSSYGSPCPIKFRKFTALYTGQRMNKYGCKT